jgi:hypothetical protein
VDWKPERAVQAKVRDFQKKKKTWLLKHARGKALCVGLQMTTSSRFFWLTMGFIPRRHLLLPCAWFFTVNSAIVSSSRKFAECWYCDVNPPPILPVLSRFIELPVIYSLYSHTSHIHTFIRSYTNTFTHLYIHALSFTHNISTTSFIHGCISHPQSWLVVSLQFSLHLPFGPG